MIKLRHERMLILICILPLKKTELSPEKKLPPRPPPPLPKNSITITETISNTRTKYQPLPEKSQPLVKNSQSLLKKSQPPKIFSTLLENVLTLPENFTCNHPENLSKPLNNSQPPGIFLNHSENFTHTLKMSQPPQYFLTPPPPRKNLNPSPDIISTLPKKSQPLPKKSQPSQENRNLYRKKCQPGLPNNSQPHPKISQPGPPQNCQPLPKICHLYRKNLTPPPPK